MKQTMEVNQEDMMMSSHGRPVGGACTHPVVEGVLWASHAAVDHTPCRWIERAVEGSRRRAGGRHLAVDRGGAGLNLHQRDGRVRDSAHVHLLPGRTNIWISGEL